MYYKGLETIKSIAIKQKQLLGWINILHRCVPGRLLLSVFSKTEG